MEVILQDDRRSATYHLPALPFREMSSGAQRGPPTTAYKQPHLCTWNFDSLTLLQSFTPCLLFLETLSTTYRCFSPLTYFFICKTFIRSNSRVALFPVSNEMILSRGVNRVENGGRQGGKVNNQERSICFIHFGLFKDWGAGKETVANLIRATRISSGPVNIGA